MTAANQPEPAKIDQPAEQASDDLPKVVSTQELFAGQREICIEHDGEKYRLRITRRNKLILQK
jgi:hemin uptake protein HemP